MSPNQNTQEGFTAEERAAMKQHVNQESGKFKARYSTLGFSDKASLDEGAMWPTSYALTELTPAVEADVAALVRRAVS